MNKPALAIVEDLAISSTKTLTLAEKLRLVLNEVISNLGCVAIKVTEQRAHACIPHELTSCTFFDEKTAYLGPRGLWIIQLQGTLCSPQAGEIPFRKWIQKSYSDLDCGVMTQPIGNFTRWN